AWSYTTKVCLSPHSIIAVAHHAIPSYDGFVPESHPNNHLEARTNHQKKPVTTPPRGRGTTQGRGGRSTGGSTRPKPGQTPKKEVLPDCGGSPDDTLVKPPTS